MPQEPRDIIFALTMREYERLLLLIGFAVGSALKDGDRAQAYRFLDLANRINQNRPNWIPYRIPPEFASEPQEGANAARQEAS